jgi:UDP-GlcNAc:undecaprenyl-phosphate GlcNAc-1-phosphate transferase
MGDIGNPLWIGTIGTGPLAVPLTILMTVTVVNAFNLIDGVDGLAGSIALIALLAIAVLASGSSTSVVAGLLATCVAAYLVFNLPISLNRRVHCFMGDAGSTMLGFVIVWLTIGICQGNERLISPVIGLWLVALPLFDLFTCIVRRVARGRSPFRGGRDHIHHTLKRGGFSGPEILLTLLMLNGSYVLIGVAGHVLSVHESLLFLLWSIAGMSQYTIVKKICTIRRAHSRRRFARA